MPARIGTTIGLALLAATWIGAVQPARAAATQVRREAIAPAKAEEEAERAARLRADARRWIARAAAYHRRG